MKRHYFTVTAGGRRMVESATGRTEEEARARVAATHRWRFDPVRIEPLEPNPWQHEPTGTVLRALSALARKWTDEANRAGQHPWSGDALRSVALALIEGRRLTVPQWNHLKMALAVAPAETIEQERHQMELYADAQAGQLEQGADGLLYVVDHYDRPPYV